MFIVPTPIVDPTQLDSMDNENTLNKKAIRQITGINKYPIPIIICYGDIPPDYECEMSTYIDTPPKYEKPLSIGEITNNVSNNVSNKEPKKSKPIKITKKKQKIIYLTAKENIVILPNQLRVDVVAHAIGYVIQIHIKNDVNAVPILFVIIGNLATFKQQKVQ